MFCSHRFHGPTVLVVCLLAVIWALSRVKNNIFLLVVPSSWSILSTSWVQNLGILAALSSADVQFDPTEQTIDSIHTLLYSHKVTCRQIVQGYLAQIVTINPFVNAIISLNNQSLALADSMDLRLREFGVNSAKHAPLFCIPVLLKDNYDTVDMPTTAGSRSLRDHHPLSDATVVTRLRDASAIILGKTNMHEFALEGLSVSSLGGQTYNPYDLSRTPGGSSGGSGAAVAASFSTFATGSDTVNSIRSPSASNSLFGIRPTRGLISRAGIIPLSYTQDAVGPIARTPRDLAIAFDVMVGDAAYDCRDNLTALGFGKRPSAAYSATLTGRALKGARIGVLTTMFNHTASNETIPVNEAMRKALDVMASAGAEMINVTHPLLDSNHTLANYDVQRFEFPNILTEYLQNQAKDGVPLAHLSFDSIYESRDFLPLCYREVLGDAAKTSIQSAVYKHHLADYMNLQIRVFTEFAKHSLDVMVYPEQKNLVVPIGALSQSGRNGILAATAGTPVVVVPAGFSPPTDSAPIGIPIGMEMMGLPFTESKLLDLAYSYDLITKVRRAPRIAASYVSGEKMTRVPKVTPNQSAHANYMEIPSGFP